MDTDRSTLDARVDTARAALVDLEGRLERGEPVGRAERRTINDEYKAAEAALEPHVAADRRAVHRDDDTSFDQTIGA